MGDNRRWGCFLLALLALSGCTGDGDPNEVVCPPRVVPGIVVEVTNENTGLFIAADAKGVVEDGTYVDSLTAFEFTSAGLVKSLQAAPDRTGVFQVSVVHPGFEEWLLGPVRVEEGECGPSTVRLRAAMTPVK